MPSTKRRRCCKAKSGADQSSSKASGADERTAGLFEKAMEVLIDQNVLYWYDAIHLGAVNKRCLFVWKQSEDRYWEPLLNLLNESNKTNMCADCGSVPYCPASERECYCGEPFRRPSFAHLDPRANPVYDGWSPSQKAKALVL